MRQLRYASLNNRLCIAMQEQEEEENAYSHSVINAHARTTTTDGGRCCSRWLTHYGERVAERREKVKKTRCSSSQWEATCLPPSLSLHSPSPALSVSLTGSLALCVSYFDNLQLCGDTCTHYSWKIHQVKAKKMKLRPIKFVHIKYKFPK